VIASIEELQGSGSGKRRERKSMGPEERQDVSEWMGQPAQIGVIRHHGSCRSDESNAVRMARVSERSVWGTWRQTCTTAKSSPV